jgi:hypothetical protein
VAHYGAQFWFDFAGVEGFGAHGAVPGAGARCAAVDVLDLGSGNELQAGLVLEETDRVRDGLKERLDLVLTVVRAESVAQVGAEEFVSSLTPAALASGLPGVQAQPPDQDVAPPQTSAFSTTMTFRPW